MQNYSHPFVKHVRHQCRRYGCNLKLIYNSKIIDDADGSSCSGYFADDPLELAVSTRVLYHDFLSTLVHEYSHFEQWIEGSEYFVSGKRNYWDIMSRWINGQNYKMTTIKKCLDVVRNCELDCDRRAIVNIAKFHIPLNIKNYCRQSSAYIHFHNFIKRKRLWEVKTNANEIPQIIKRMPDNLDGDYSVTPRKIMHLYYKHLKPYIPKK